MPVVQVTIDLFLSGETCPGGADPEAANRGVQAENLQRPRAFETTNEGSRDLRHRTTPLGQK